MIRFSGARIVDPGHPNHLQVADLLIDGSQLVDSAAKQAAPASCQTFDMSGCIAMAGGIDIHTHIGGGKVNLARLLMADESRWMSSIESHCEQNSVPRRTMQDHLKQGGPIWSSQVTGELYCGMGYTACFEPAMLLTQARGTHLQLADTPLLDSGAYVVMGNEDWLLKALQRGVPQQQIQQLIAWTLNASQSLAVKVVNAGGINAFKFGQRLLDVDEPHARYGITPRQIIRELTAAIDALQLSHPLHVHASNLGMPGNLSATLATIDAAEGHRLHLTHAQFHAYTNEGPYGMGSGAEILADRVNATPNLTIDVGQVIFGQTVTISADTAAQSRNAKFGKPNKSIVSDVECVGGCGVVPMRYESSHYVSSLQWAIGLELLLLVKNPYQVFLTTDHPNGGPFTSYPHLIRLLMDRTYRQQMLTSVHAVVAERSLLKDIEREYTLEEIAILTRAAPARILGLHDRGHLKAGGLADIVFYRVQSDWEQTFTTARSVWKRGVEVMRDGCKVNEPPTCAIVASTQHADTSMEHWRDSIEQTLRLPLESLCVSKPEMEQSIGRPIATVGAAR